MLAGLATDPQDDMRVSDAQDSGTNELLSDVIENLRNRASAGGDGIYDAVEAFAEELETQRLATP